MFLSATNKPSSNTTVYQSPQYFQRIVGITFGITPKLNPFPVSR